MNHKYFRIAAAFVMIVSVIWGYWWLTWIFAIAFLFVFPSYYEIMVWGVMYDALYGLALPQFGGYAYVFTTSSIILFVVAFGLRKMLLAYESTI